MPRHTAKSWTGRLHRYKATYKEVIKKARSTQRPRRSTTTRKEAVHEEIDDEISSEAEENNAGDWEEAEQMVEKPASSSKHGLDALPPGLKREELDDFEIIVSFLVEQDFDMEDEESLWLMLEDQVRTFKYFLLAYAEIYR
jgi:HD superfamily phosphodiesterase